MLHCLSSPLMHLLIWLPQLSRVESLLSINNVVFNNLTYGRDANVEPLCHSCLWDLVLIEKKPGFGKQPLLLLKPLPLLRPLLLATSHSRRSLTSVHGFIDLHLWHLMISNDLGCQPLEVTSHLCTTLRLAHLQQTDEVEVQFSRFLCQPLNLIEWNQSSDCSTFLFLSQFCSRVDTYIRSEEGPLLLEEHLLHVLYTVLTQDLHLHIRHGNVALTY